jgi:hypothetical protein
VIPAAFAGSHAINPVLARGRWIAAAALIPGLLGLREFPVSLSQLLWTPLAGLFAFHFLSPIPAGLLTLAAFSASFALPLVPTRITLRFLAPIDVRAETAGLGRLPARLESAYQRVTTRLQAGLDAMKEAHE